MTPRRMAGIPSGTLPSQIPCGALSTPVVVRGTAPQQRPVTALSLQPTVTGHTFPRLLVLGSDAGKPGAVSLLGRYATAPGINRGCDMTLKRPPDFLDD